MKKTISLVAILLLFSLLLSGCNLLDFLRLDTKQVESREGSSTMPVVSDSLESIPLPSQDSNLAESKPVISSTPLGNKVPYLKAIPAEACVFREPDANSAFSQTIGADGTFTIVEEEYHGNGDCWGRLKSGVGWVNLTDFFCHGNRVPAVTVSETGKIVKNSDHHQAGEGSGEYVVYLTFMAHRTVCNLTLTEESSTGNQTVMTMSELTPEKPLVVGVLFSDVNSFELTYRDAAGARGSARVDQNLGDGPALEFSYS